MKKVAFILLAFVAFACNEHEITYSVDPALETYVSTFYSEAAERGVTLPLNLVAEVSTKAQSVANVHTWESQNYLFVAPAIFNNRTAQGLTRYNEADIYKVLTQLFMHRTVEYTPTGDREAEFNEAFN